MRRSIVVAAWAVIAAVGLFLFLAGDVPVALSRADSMDLSSPWRSSGPTADSQPLAVNSLEASPSYAADNTLFAATDGGVYRSQDRGQSWQLLLASSASPPATPPTVAERFSHVRLSPDFNGDGILFAVYQQSDSDSALLKSSDRGGTWQTSATFTETVVALRLSTDFPIDNTLFALTGDGRVLQKSTDGGQHWTRLFLNRHYRK